MRLRDIEHTSRPWRIHELTRDFRVRTCGRSRWQAAGTISRGSQRSWPRRTRCGAPHAVRALWAIRVKIGEMLGWDSPDAGPGSRAGTLRERLPADLRDARGPDFAALPFTPLYLLGEEFAAEMANRTVRAVMHVGWVPDGSGAYPLISGSSVPS